MKEKKMKFLKKTKTSDAYKIEVSFKNYQELKKKIKRYLDFYNA